MFILVIYVLRTCRDYLFEYFIRFHTRSRNLCAVNMCHNPIFTPEIFLGVDMQNEAAWTKSAWFDKGSPHQITSKRGQGHISLNLTQFN